MLICFHWSLYFLETSQFSGFFTLWLDGLFSFDCLILGDLQVLFLLFAGGGQRTRNRHIAQTPQAWRNINVGKRSIICHVKILVGRVNTEDPCEIRHEIQWKMVVIWSNCLWPFGSIRSVRMVAACVNPCTRRRCGPHCGLLPLTSDIIMWVFPKIGIPQNGWFIMEIPIKMDDLGVPLFLETPMSCWHQRKSLRCGRSTLATPTVACRALVAMVHGECGRRKTWDLWRDGFVKRSKVQSIEKQSCFYCTHETCT